MFPEDSDVQANEDKQFNFFTEENASQKLNTFEG
jgi:hypothetical protein